MITQTSFTLSWRIYYRSIHVHNLAKPKLVSLIPSLGRSTKHSFRAKINKQQVHHRCTKHKNTHAILPQFAYSPNKISPSFKRSNFTCNSWSWFLNELFSEDSSTKAPFVCPNLSRVWRQKHNGKRLWWAFTSHRKDMPRDYFWRDTLYTLEN